jgi:alanine dehydrogenase
VRIGLLKENKPGEGRVILTPNEVRDLTAGGHEVFVQAGAGTKAGFADDDYVCIGAVILPTMEAVYEKATLIAKVKEFLPEEYPLLRNDHILFGCIHPAAHQEEVSALLEAKVIALTAEDSHRVGSPNGEAAGKIGALMGAYHLLGPGGGRGQTMFGIGGAPAGKALVLGAGIAGRGATRVLSSLGAQVVLMDISIGVLREAGYEFPGNVTTMISSRGTILEVLGSVDLVVNCVKWPKHRKDHLIYREDLKLMKSGAVIVDVSADVGGGIETYKPTTHFDPTFVVEGIVHYGVDNIPGAAPHTVSRAYAASIASHLKSIADRGLRDACVRDGYLRRSLCVYKGQLTHEETSVIQGRPMISAEKALGLEGEQKLDWAPKATSTSA